MDGTAFEHEVRGTVGVDALDLADLLRNEIVLIPRKIQAVDQTAPGIEFPVNGADIALVVDNERRAAVTDPGIVARHFYNADLGGKHVARMLILRGADAHRHRLKLSNGLRNLGKDLLRGLRTVAPVVGTFRPKHPDLFLLLKLTGHSEAVSLRGAFNSLRHFFRSFLNNSQIRRKNIAVSCTSYTCIVPWIFPDVSILLDECNTGKRKVLCYKLRNTARRSNNNCTGISGKTLVQERFHYGNHAASRRNIRALTVDLVGENIEIQIAHVLDRVVVSSCERNDRRCGNGENTFDLLYDAAVVSGIGENKQNIIPLDPAQDGGKLKLFVRHFGIEAHHRQQPVKISSDLMAQTLGNNEYIGVPVHDGVEFADLFVRDDLHRLDYVFEIAVAVIVGGDDAGHVDLPRFLLCIAERLRKLGIALIAELLHQTEDRCRGDKALFGEVADAHVLYDMQVFDYVVKQVLLCRGQAGYAAACLLIKVHMTPPVSHFVTYFTVICNVCQQTNVFTCFAIRFFLLL